MQQAMLAANTRPRAADDHSAAGGWLGITQGHIWGLSPCGVSQRVQHYVLALWHLGSLTQTDQHAMHSRSAPSVHRPSQVVGLDRWRMLCPRTPSSYRCCCNLCCNNGLASPTLLLGISSTLDGLQWVPARVVHVPWDVCTPDTPPDPSVKCLHAIVEVISVHLT